MTHITDEGGKLVEQVAEAIYSADEPLSGDTIGAVIHMSDHLFYDSIEGKTDLECQIAAVKIICRAAAKAATAAMFEMMPTGEMLQAGNRVWLDGGNERQIFEAMMNAARGEK